MSVVDLALDQLRRAARAAVVVANIASNDPLAQVDWLPPQVAFLECTEKVKLLRAGQQAVGKSWVGLAECIMLCTGRHPHQVGRRIEECWVVTASWSQSVAIQKKLWELVPKEHVHRDQLFDPVRGFGGHVPALRFRNGAIIKIKTTHQGALDLASASIDHVLFDEPPKSTRVFNEVRKRVQARAGTVSLTLTPINAPCDWLKEECEAGKIRDLHFRLEPQNLIHVRSGRVRTLPDGTKCDEAWITQVRYESMEHEEPVVCDGEWETRAVERRFTQFSRETHVCTQLPAELPILLLGNDHGENIGRQAGVLVGLVEDGTDFPDVYVIDEYRPGDRTTQDDDARNLLTMLGRHGSPRWSWSNLDEVHGDRNTSAKRSITNKSNAQLEKYIARELGIRVENLKPKVRSAKRGRNAGRGAVDAGVRWLHWLMLKGKLHVHARCINLIESFEKWDGKENSPLKDLLDALRYSLHSWILGRNRRRGTVRVQLG